MSGPGGEANPEAGPDPEERPRGTFRIGSLFGSDVLLTSSWFLGAALISISIAPWVRNEQPGLGSLSYLVGFLLAVVLYLSVLLHEASHAVAARHYGFRVSSVTLHFLGGHTQIEGSPRSPRQEFVIAVVGPITSLVIGVAGLLLGAVVPAGLLRMAVDLLALANLVVGVLNLVPGLPLDGGRVLKALVWKVTGNAHRGTLAAGWGGRLVALCALAWPYLMGPLLGWQATVTDYLLGVVIALFLWTGASAAIASARLRARLPQLVAARLARRTLAVPDDLPVAEAVRRAREAEAGSIITVTASGQPVGIVSEAAIRATPPERQPWLAVSTLARTLEPTLILPADIAGEELILRMQRAPASEYLLVDAQGGVAGVLATADVDRAFREGRR